MKSPRIGSRWFRLGALLAAVTLLAPDAHSQEPSVAAPPLRVGVSPVFPPMVFKQQGQLAGIEVDLARALGERLGRAVVFVELPWEDQIEALQKGRTDIIMSALSITPARAFPGTIGLGAAQGG